MIDKSFTGEKLLVSGWGVYNISIHGLSPKLKAAVVNGISNEDCKTAYGVDDGVRILFATF
jgi:hypothetical protein